MQRLKPGAIPADVLKDTPAQKHRSMSVQHARLENLRAVVLELEAAGHASREAQAAFLGGAVTPRCLQAMLDGAHIHALFAGHLEFILRKPRGWMSRCHEGDGIAERQRLESEAICERLGRFVVS